MGNAVVSLFFENSFYRAGSQGRKHRAQDFFGAGFRFPEVTIRRQGFLNVLAASERGHCPACGTIESRLGS